MSTPSSVENKRRLKFKLDRLNADILSAQEEYRRIYSSTGLSPTTPPGTRRGGHLVGEQLRTALTLETDLQIVKRRSLGTSTFEDKNDDARDSRVAALERMYELQ